MYTRNKNAANWAYESVQSEKCSPECVNPHSRWIQCDICGDFKHATCIGLTNEKLKTITSYTCRDCKKGRRVPAEDIPEERLIRSRTPEEPSAEPARAAEEFDDRVESPHDDESDFSEAESEPQYFPKTFQAKQRCPCGNNGSMAICVKCYFCTQVFHAACAGITADEARKKQFICMDCQDQDEQEAQNRDRDLAGLLDLREDLNQSERIGKLPEYTKKFEQRLYGRESYDFENDDFDRDSAPTENIRHSSPLSGKASPKPRQTILRNRGADEQRDGQRSSADRAAETPSRVKVTGDEDGQMQSSQTIPPDKGALLNESELGRRLLTGAQAPAKKGSAAEKAAAADIRAKGVSAETAVPVSGMQILRRKTGAQGGVGQSGQLNRRNTDQPPLSPMLNQFEKVVVENRLKETGEHLVDVEHEYQVTLARLNCLAREREKLQKRESSRSAFYNSLKSPPVVKRDLSPTFQVKTSDSGTLYRKYTGDSPDRSYRCEVAQHARVDDVPSRSVHFNENRIPSSYQRSNTDMSTDAVQKQVGALAIGESNPKKANGEKGPPPKSNDPNMEIGKAVLTLAEQMAQLHASNRYVTGLTTLKVLTGAEGPEGIRRYFRQFELMTRDWSVSEKLDALSVKLEGKANLVYSSMPFELQNSFDAVKSELLERLANEGPKRVRKLADLMSGKPRASNESIAAFGERVLQLVRDACDSDCPASQIDELCKAYFVNWVNDRELISSLTEKRDTLEFRKLVDHAAALRANLDPYKRVANESNAFNSAAPQVQPANANKSTVPTQRRDMPPPHREAPHHFNPNRMPLRYQGQFPPPRNSFAGNRGAGTAANSNATETRATLEGTEQAAATPALIKVANDPELTNIWQTMPASYVDPLDQGDYYCPRSARRRRRRRNEEEPPVTSNVLDVEDAPEDTSGEVTKEKAAAFVSAMNTVPFPASIGGTCTAIVLVRSMPCEALVDSGSRISLVEVGYLKGLLLKSGAKLEDMTLRKSGITSISCANRSKLNSPAALTVEVAYGGQCVSVELQVTTERLAFPLILGTNCLSDLGFQLINVHTGEELLSVVSEESGSENIALPAVDVCATADAIIPPYGAAIISARLAEEGSSNIRCVSSCVDSTVPVDALVNVENNEEMCFWLTNSESLTVTIAEGQVVGKAHLVDEIFTSSDIIATDVLEELLDQTETVVSCATSRRPLKDARFVPPPCTPGPRDERLRKLIELIGDPEVELSEEQSAQLVDLLSEYRDVFALSDSELGQTNLVKHKIELVDRTPIRQPERPLPYVMREKVAAMIRDYLERKVIRPSSSSFSSPIVLVRKKPEKGSEGEAQLRFCVDYRALNARTAKFAGPIPNIDYLLLTMGPKQFFTSLDMISGYWQIELEESSKPLTAFPALGKLYEFNVLSFGLTNAPASFQLFMQRVFDGIVNDYVYLFLDDILIVSCTWEEHVAHLREVFARLRHAQLKLKPNKCRIAVREAKYLGHILSPDGLKMDPDKVAPMSHFPRPKNVRDVQSFRGLVGHYRKFIKGFALICRPLDELTMKGVAFTWGDRQEFSFTELKRLVCEEGTLQFPDFKAAKDDPMRPLVLQTDACKEGVAGILGQKDERGAMRPIHFVSRTTKHSEKNYGITELEALSVKYCFTKLAPYLIGLPVVVETDHSALVSMFTKAKECGNSRIDKWAMHLMSRFDFKVVYKPGKANVAADALSRSVAAQGIVVVAVTTRRMAREKEKAAHQSGLPPILEELESDLPEKVRKKVRFEDESSVAAEGETGATECKTDWNECLAESEFADIYAFLKDRELPKGPEEMHALLRKAENFALVEGKLHFLSPENAELRLFVPEQFRQKLFNERHSGIFAAHACGAKIVGMLKRKFWWPGMRTDCEKWARACQVCLFTRKPRNNVPPLQPIESSALWEILCIDLLQLPLTISGHKYALICVDHFSKYLITCPLHDKTAESVAEALVRKVFLIYGACQRLHSDLGGEFCNKIISVLTETFKMGQTTTAGYNPRCNGLAERMGRQLIKMLSQTVPIPQCWSDRLDFVTFAQNISPHQETGESAYFLIFARDASFPSEVTESLTFSPYAVDLDDFRSIMMQNLGNAVQNVRAALDRSRERAKRYYDLRNKANPHKYRVGQRVMVYDPSIPHTVAKKLDWKYFGPFRITEIANNNAKVYPVDKPFAEPQLVPLDRLSPIPAEIPPISYAKGANRAKILAACIYASNDLLSVTQVELNVASVKDDIPLNLYAQSEEKDRFLSKEKLAVLFTAFEANGLGPFYQCRGKDVCSANCSDVLLREVIPTLPECTASETKVFTLGHQVYLAALSRRFDGSELVEKASAVISCPAAELAASFSSICAGTETPEITRELVLSQARFRQNRCDRVAAALIQSGGRPLIMVGATPADHPIFSAITFVQSRLVHTSVSDNLMGKIWEEVRHGAGKPLVASPFIALVSPGDKALVRGQHMTIVEAPDLLAINFYLQQHAFFGSVQSIIVGLPPTTPQCTARIDTLVSAARAYSHVQLVLLPPPPSGEPSYRDVVAKLIALQDQTHLRATALGRSIFEVGFFGRGPDRRFVDKSGKWSDSGRALLRQHLLEVAALRPLKVYQRPAPPQPAVRSQIFVPQRSNRQEEPRKRPYQPAQLQQKPHYYNKQTRHQ